MSGRARAVDWGKVPLLPTVVEEQRLWRDGYCSVAGLDEVGRGPIAGPVVAGAAVFHKPPSGSWTRFIRDSKRLSPSRREEVLPMIREVARSVSTGEASSEEIDQVGIAAAVRLAMVRALEGLSVDPDYLLIDAFGLPEAQIPQTAIIRGDATCLSIAAASIAAKVERDRIMVGLDRLHPGYGFARHKGYLTRSHADALRRLGPSPVHRFCFAPVKAAADATGHTVEPVKSGRML